MLENKMLFFSKCEKITNISKTFSVLELSHWATCYLSDKYIRSIDYMGDFRYESVEHLVSHVLPVYTAFNVHNKFICSAVLTVTLMKNDFRPVIFKPTFFLIHEGHVDDSGHNSITDNLGAKLLYIDKHLSKLTWY